MIEDVQPLKATPRVTYCFASRDVSVTDALRETFQGCMGIDIFCGSFMDRRYDAEYVSASISIELGVRPEPLEATVFRWKADLAARRPSTFGIAAGILKPGMDPFGAEASYHMMASVIRAVNAYNQYSSEPILIVGLLAERMLAGGVTSRAHRQALRAAYDELAR